MLVPPTETLDSPRTNLSGMKLNDFLLGPPFLGRPGGFPERKSGIRYSGPVNKPGGRPVLFMCTLRGRPGPLRVAGFTSTEKNYNKSNLKKVTNK